MKSHSWRYSREVQQKCICAQCAEKQERCDAERRNGIRQEINGLESRGNSGAKIAQSGSPTRGPFDSLNLHASNRPIHLRHVRAVAETLASAASLIAESIFGFQVMVLVHLMPVRGCLRAKRMPNVSASSLPSLSFVSGGHAGQCDQQNAALGGRKWRRPRFAVGNAEHSAGQPWTTLFRRLNRPRWSSFEKWPTSLLPDNAEHEHKRTEALSSPPSREHRQCSFGHPFIQQRRVRSSEPRSPSPPPRA